jgi:hypothetical protein
MTSVVVLSVSVEVVLPRARQGPGPAHTATLILRTFDPVRERGHLPGPMHCKGLSAGDGGLLM